MKILSFVLAAMMATGLALTANAADAPSDRYGKQKVVYHINYPGGEGDKAYKGAMRNIQNHINAVGADNLDLKVVIHGNGYNLLKNAKTDSQLSATIDNLKSQHVSFAVCANTLRGKKVDREKDLYDVDAADVVPSGVAELAHLQQQGYAYIKP